jgi:hypothetical protein
MANGYGKWLMARVDGHQPSNRLPQPPAICHLPSTIAISHLAISHDRYRFLTS